jgi:ferredoxin
VNTSEGALITVRFVPKEREVRVARGTTVMEATKEAGLTLGASCESDLLCGLCRVRVLTGLDHLSPPEDDELRVMAALDAGREERLACRAEVLGEVTVTADYW